MTKRLWAWVAIPVLASAATFFAGYAGLPGYVLAYLRGDPRLDAPDVIELGERQQGAVVTSQFAIKNAGRSELHIREVRASCGCTGVEQAINGKFFRITSLDLAPGQSADLSLRWIVRARPGAPERIAVDFQTNDPQRPTGRILFVIPSTAGGVNAIPSTVVFGSIVAGEKVTQLVELRGEGLSPQEITKVVSSIPTCITARLLPKQEETEETHPLGGLIGRVEVIGVGEPNRRLDGEIAVYGTKQENPLLIIPVTGQVVPEVEVTPSTLVLPRRSGKELVYQAICLCRSTRAEPLHLQPEAVRSRV